MTIATRPRPSPRAVVPVPEPERRLSLVERIQKALAPKTSPNNVPDIITNLGTYGAVGMVTQNTVLRRVPGAESYRAYAATPWVFAGINIRTDQVASADWDIVPYDNTKRHAARQQERLRELFAQPSAKLDSFQSFAKVVIRELLTLDGAPIEKVRYPDGTIAELWPTRGDWIAVDERWDGSDPDRARYFFVPDGTVRASFKNEDMVYLVANQQSTSALGIPPMAVLQTVIESELQALEYNRRQVMGAAPDGVLNIGESADPTAVQAAQSKFQAEIFGQGAMAIIGGYKSPSFLKFRDTNRDMQFREWEDLLIRCIAVVLGLAPQDLGITFDVNRSTSEQQASNTEDRGLRPLMALFQSYMTREVVWDKSFGGKEANLAFKFADLTLDESLSKANINKVAMPGIGWKSINEARRVDGRPPIGEPNDEANVFDHILIGTPKGTLDLNTGKYLGEEQLAEIAAKSQISVTEAKGKVDAANADKAAETARATAAAAPKPPVTKSLTPDEWTHQIKRAMPDYSSLLDQQLELTKALAAAAGRPINIEVQPAQVTVEPPSVTVQAPTVSVPPAQVTIEKGAIQVEVEVKSPPTKRRIQRDAEGRIEAVIEDEETPA